MKFGFYALAAVAWVAVGAFQIWVMSVALYTEWGWLGLIGGWAAFPITLIGLPIYRGVTSGDWSLLIFFPLAIAFAGLGMLATFLRRDVGEGSFGRDYESR
jgi:hypothetical protein